MFSVIQNHLTTVLWILEAIQTSLDVISTDFKLNVTSSSVKHLDILSDVYSLSLFYIYIYTIYTIYTRCSVCSVAKWKRPVFYETRVKLQLHRQPRGCSSSWARKSGTMHTNRILFSPKWRSSSGMATRWSGRKRPGNLRLLVRFLFSTMKQNRRSPLDASVKQTHIIFILTFSIQGGSSSRKTWKRVEIGGANLT